MAAGGATVKPTEVKAGVEVEAKGSAFFPPEWAVVRPVGAKLQRPHHHRTSLLHRSVVAADGRQVLPGFEADL